MSEESETKFEPGFGPCGVCGASGRLNARVCRSCEDALGRRTAELVARARADHTFAAGCFSGMNALAQRRFVTMLGDPTLDGPWEPRAARFTLAGPSMRKSTSAVRPGIAKAADASRTAQGRQASR